MLNREAVLEEIERLSSSEALHNSESLCKLLRYLAEQSLNNPGATIKEYQIATEVFHRSADFDPQLDSVIRVQAGRLRTKLASYYSTEGEEDRIVVELPKGNYALHFRENHVKKNKAPEIAEAVANEHPVAPSDDNRRFAPPPYTTSALIAVLVTVVAVLGILLAWRKPTVVQSQGVTVQAPAAYQMFWGHFVSGSEVSWVVFSNATFTGRPETGLRYYNPNSGQPVDARGPVFDHYTGVGEVLAVHDLDEVFASLHGHVRVKRGSLFSLDDLKQNNLIFLGSPAENLTLRDIPTTTHFVFRRLSSGTRSGDLSIATISPQAGEPETSVASPANQQLTEDYALIGLKHGVESSHLVLIIAGTTTFGTQGAVEYLCREESLQELLTRLGVKRAEDLRPFEALLRIRISRGVPVETSLVAVHPDEQAN